VFALYRPENFAESCPNCFCEILFLKVSKKPKTSENVDDTGTERVHQIEKMQIFCLLLLRFFLPFSSTGKAPGLQPGFRATRTLNPEKREIKGV